MKVIIACAGRKCPDAGYWTAEEGKKVKFVARPEHAPADDGCIYARPDDKAASGKTWRELLLEYNEKYRKENANPKNLYRACDLYEPNSPYQKIYRDLVGQFREENVFILSAGWGLIRSDFLTPQYDITFSVNAEALVKRVGQYRDICEIEENEDDVICAALPKSYTAFFRRLTKNIGARKVLFYNPQNRPPQCPGAELKEHRSESDSRYTWHYACAQALLNNKLRI